MILPAPRVKDIRREFVNLLNNSRFTTVSRESSMTNLVGGTTIEIINANFISDEESIFGNVNYDYVKREEEWYNSRSLNVNDIPGGTPAIWKAVADSNGFINSNYGWCIYSEENGFQYQKALSELLKNPESRRSVMIYNRPSMWVDYNKNGRSDFMCTNIVQYVIRNGSVHAIVQMRSNDGWAGYRNDRAWQLHVLEKLTADLNQNQNDKLLVGDLHWNAGSLHMYSRNYYLVDHYSKTGDIHISKEDYKLAYPNSPYN